MLGLLTLLSFLPLLQGHAALTPPSLSDIERSRLRYRLENLFNEQDLMIRNQKVDKSDIEHQRKEMEALRVYDRIPFKNDIPGLRTSLVTTAKTHALTIQAFKLLPMPRARPRPVPQWIYTDVQPAFRFSEDQLVKQIPFAVTVRGDEEAVRNWMTSWATDQWRLAEPIRASQKSPIRKVGAGLYEVSGRAFRFTPVQFPQLRTRDPIALLPAWAAHSPQKFAQQEPMIWDYVTRIRGIAPQARPFYRNRERMLLGSARMSFFISRAVSRGLPLAPGK